MLKRLALLFCLLAAPLVAQTPSPNLAGIAHIALQVKDLDASIAFYQKLGFEKAFDLSRDGKVYEAFIKINDRQFIELYPVDAKHPQVGFLHVCFEAADIQSVHDYYVAQGLKPIDVRKAGAGNLLFTMPGPMTPQGAQNMEYTQYMPGSLHSNDFGKHLGADRIGNELSYVGIAVDDLAAAAKFYAQAGFPVGAPGVIRLPGSAEAMFLMSSAQLGMRAAFRISSELTADAVAARLRNEHLTPAADSQDPRLLDPDGNSVTILATGPGPKVRAVGK